MVIEFSTNKCGFFYFYFGTIPSIPLLQSYNYLTRHKPPPQSQIHNGAGGLQFESIQLNKSFVIRPQKDNNESLSTSTASRKDAIVFRE